jgi:hypothetical protein
MKLKEKRGKELNNDDNNIGVSDLKELTSADLQLNIKTLLDSYVVQASVAEKVLVELVSTRNILELFLLEMIERGESVEELASKLDKVNDSLTSTANDNSNNNDQKTVFFKEKKHIGNVE